MSIDKQQLGTVIKSAMRAGARIKVKVLLSQIPHSFLFIRYCGDLPGASLTSVISTLDKNSKALVPESIEDQALRTTPCHLVEQDHKGVCQGSLICLSVELA